MQKAVERPEAGPDRRTVRFGSREAAALQSQKLGRKEKQYLGEWSGFMFVLW